MKPIFVALLMIATTVKAEPVLLWSLDGFEAPESVVAIPGKNQYLVSNIQGHPAAADGQGFLSLVSTDGQWINKHWATGLDAPKGLAISGNRVFVSDLTALKIFELSSGKLLNSYTHPQARFLNDVAADPSGAIYVSDMLSGAIYRFKNSEFTRWLELPAIPHPNGLSFNNDKLLLASWGLGMKEDFSTETKGGLFEIDTRNREITPISNAQAFANLDAVEITSNGMITNDWINGDVYRVKEDGPELLFNAGISAADFGVDQERLLIPVMMENRVDVYQFKQ